jgi:hypothetical protein
VKVEPIVLSGVFCAYARKLPLEVFALQNASSGKAPFFRVQPR